MRFAGRVCLPYEEAMVIVFDVDGTLIGGEEQDWPSFDGAIFEVLGFHPDRAFWDTVEEVTGRAIIRKALAWSGVSYQESIEQEIRKRYLGNLRKAAPFKNTVFQPKPGAVEILNLLKQTPIFEVAIATGDFKETSHFKLGSARMEIAGVPYASCSDEEMRKDIISKAVDRAGESIVDARIYRGRCVGSPGMSATEYPFYWNRP